MFLDAPRGFKDVSRITQRIAMLGTSETIQPLEQWARDVEDRRRGSIPDVVVPHFDPADAGISARILLLLEAPGPKTVPEWGGSGFISSDNNDVTAENVWRARDAAGLYDQTLIWNMNPWVLGRADRKPTALELAHGGSELRGLLNLLTELRVVIVSGRKAQAGWNTHVSPFIGSRYTVIDTWHPAGQSFAQPGHRAAFQQALSRAEHLAR